MYLYRTIDKLKGKGFTYTKSQRCEGVGKPLQEFHSLEIGNEMIDIVSQNQLILVLNEHDIPYSKVCLRSEMFITIVGEGNRTVTFSYGFEGMKVIHVHFNKFKAYVREAVEEAKQKIKAKYDQEIKNENSVLDRVCALVK